MSRAQRAGRSRNATEAEIASKLRNTGDYLGAMIAHDATAVKATTGERQDLDNYKEGYRQFCRDLSGFLTSARSTWTYMLQSVTASGHKEWLNGRLYEDVICRFHRELANQDIHHHEIMLAIDQRVNVESAVQPLLPGTHLLQIPLRVTGFEGVNFFYKIEDLEGEAQVVYRRLLMVHGRQSVTELAARYYAELHGAFKTGSRRTRFTPPAP